MVRSTYERVVDWGDCDPAQIVFYPNFYRWFDAATRHLFEAAGLPWQELFPRYDVVGLPLREAKARFVSPARYGDHLRIESTVGERRESQLLRLDATGRDAVFGYVLSAESEDRVEVEEDDGRLIVWRGDREWERERP